MGVFIAPGPLFVFINVNVLKLLHGNCSRRQTSGDECDLKLIRFAEHGTGSNHIAG
jgi:hypothetical protein